MSRTSGWLWLRTLERFTDALHKPRTTQIGAIVFVYHVLSLDARLGYLLRVVAFPHENGICAANVMSLMALES